MTPRMTVTTHDGIADIRLNRPEKMNALDPAMFRALLDTADALSRDDSVRVAVLSGNGRAFCAGLDLQSFAAMRAQDGEAAGSHRDSDAGAALFGLSLEQRTHGIANAYQQVALAWRQLAVPVIAAVHGVAFGGGLQIALGADIRIVAPDARMSVMEVKWGLVPDMAGILLMRQLARDDVVRELTYTGRQITGAQAQQIGFATSTDERPYEAAMALAGTIAGQSPDAIRAAKRLLNLPNHDASAVLVAESVEQARLIGSPGQLAAVQANLAPR